MTTMFKFRASATAAKQAASKPSVPGHVDLEAMSRETGVPVEVLKTFAGISDPANADLFSAESAYKAFGVETLQAAHA